MAGRKHKVAAQKPAAKVADKQEVAGAPAPENNSGNGDATAGELAAIGRAEAAEGDLARIADALAGARIGGRNPDERPADTAIRVIAAYPLAVDAELRLGGFLKSRAGFKRRADEAPGDAAIRVIEALDSYSSPEAEPQPAEPARSEYALAVEGEVLTYADLIGIVGDDARLAIRFGDGEVFVGAPISVGAEDLKPLGRQAVYERRISFPVDSPSGRVTAAWLIGGDHAVRCDIPGGLRVGGGAQASVPAGHLIF